MVVAAAAVDGQSQKGLPGGGHDVVQLIEVVLVGIGCFVIEQTQTIKTSGDDRFGGDLGQFVAGELLADELIVRLVLVECANQIIAITPDKRLGGVAFVTVGLCITDDIHPVSCPAFTKLRGSDQSINKSRVSIGCLRVGKGLDLFGWGR